MFIQNKEKRGNFFFGFVSYQNMDNLCLPITRLRSSVWKMHVAAQPSRLNDLDHKDACILMMG